MNDLYLKYQTAVANKEIYRINYKTLYKELNIYTPFKDWPKELQEARHRYLSQPEEMAKIKKIIYDKLKNKYFKLDNGKIIVSIIGYNGIEIMELEEYGDD